MTLDRSRAGRAILLALLLSGCASSPPTRYYSLSAVPIQPVQAAAASPPIMLDPISLPPELDRLQLVRQATADRLDIASLDRWAAPLDELVRRALSADLAAALPAGTVLPPDAAAAPPDLRHVAVTIDRFDGDLSGHVVLAAHWSLVADDAAVLRRDSRLETDAPSAAIDALPGAMSEALGRLAREIATAAGASIEAAPRR